MTKQEYRLQKAQYHLKQARWNLEQAGVTKEELKRILFSFEVRCREHIPPITEEQRKRIIESSPLDLS